MTEQEHGKCPRCDDAEGTVNLRALRAEEDASYEKAREARARDAAARKAADPDTEPSRAGRGLAWVGRKTILSPLEKWVVPAAARHGEKTRRTYDRYPDLWLCPRDDVVFRAGGANTVPSADAEG
jgi:hypothetical protein